MICFIVRELRAPFPIVDLRIFKNRNFAVGCLLFLMFGGVLYALTTMQPLFLQSLLDYTALDAGLTVSPRGLGVLVALGLVGVLVQRVDSRKLVVFGFVILAVACFQFSRLTLQVAMSNIVPPNLIAGFGMGFIFVPLTGLTLGTLRNEQIGNGTGIQNLMRNIGGSIGISFVTTMLVRYAQAHQVFLVSRVSPLDPAYQQQVGMIQLLFQSHYSPADALERAQSFIYNNVVLHQADYWAYMQLFFFFAWASAAGALGVGLFRSVKPGRSVAVH
jgi:DHA2 family multidrug resistance protein